MSKCRNVKTLKGLLLAHGFWLSYNFLAFGNQRWVRITNWPDYSLDVIASVVSGSCKITQ